MQGGGKLKKKIYAVTHPNVFPTTLGQRSADKLTKLAGSWSFIISFIIIMIIWIFANVYAWIQTWDPYPFILLNLFLSCVAAIQAPIILMSQNRESQKDRQRSEYDYAVNRKAEREINQIRKIVNRIDRKFHLENVEYPPNSSRFGNREELMKQWYGNFLRDNFSGNKLSLICIDEDISGASATKGHIEFDFHPFVFQNY